MELPTKKQIHDLSYQIIGAAIEVHKVLGPGLLEKVYQPAMVRELSLRHLQTSQQRAIIIDYKGVDLDCDLRYDLLVEDLIVCELKAVTDMHPIFDATLLSYMKHLKVPKGILLNFHVRNIFRDGQKSFVNEFYAALPDE